MRKLLLRILGKLLGPHKVDCLTCGGLGVWWEGEYEHHCPYCNCTGKVFEGSQTRPWEVGRW